MPRFLPWRDGLRRGVKKNALSSWDYDRQSIYKKSDFVPPPFPKFNTKTATPSDALLHVRRHIRNCVKELLPPRRPKAIVNECCDNIDAVMHAKLQDRCFADALRAAVWKAEEKADYYSPWSNASKCAFSFTIPKLLKKHNIYWTQWIDPRLISLPRKGARTADMQTTRKPQGSEHAVPLLRLSFDVRRKIYEYVFDATVQYRRRKLVVNGLLPNYARQPALTRTCSRIRREALPVYYSCSVFVVVLDGRYRSTSLKVTGFDYQDLYYQDHYAVAPKHWTAIQIGLDLPTLSITGFSTDHVKSDEHLAWKHIMLQQMKRDIRCQVITPKLLNKLLASFAQDFGEVWQKKPRIQIHPTISVLNSGLDMGWVVWPGHRF